MTLACLPKRDGPGTYGRKILIETNHLLLEIKDLDCKIYHYDVEVKPDKPFRLYRFVYIYIFVFIVLLKLLFSLLIFLMIPLCAEFISV